MIFLTGPGEEARYTKRKERRFRKAALKMKKERFGKQLYYRYCRSFHRRSREAIGFFYIEL